MKKLAGLILVGSLFAAVGCGPKAGQTNQAAPPPAQPSAVPGAPPAKFFRFPSQRWMTQPVLPGDLAAFFFARAAPSPTKICAPDRSALKCSYITHIGHT